MRLYLSFQTHLLLKEELELLDPVDMQTSLPVYITYEILIFLMLFVVLYKDCEREPRMHFLATSISKQDSAQKGTAFIILYRSDFQGIL